MCVAAEKQLSSTCISNLSSEKGLMNRKRNNSGLRRKDHMSIHQNRRYSSETTANEVNWTMNTISGIIKFNVRLALQEAFGAVEYDIWNWFWELSDHWSWAGFSCSFRWNFLSKFQRLHGGNVQGRLEFVNAATNFFVVPLHELHISNWKIKILFNKHHAVLRNRIAFGSPEDISVVSRSDCHRIVHTAYELFILTKQIGDGIATVVNNTKPSEAEAETRLFSLYALLILLTCKNSNNDNKRGVVYSNPWSINFTRQD